MWVADEKNTVPRETADCGRRDSSQVPAKEVRCLIWNCRRESRMVAGMGSGLSMEVRA